MRALPVNKQPGLYRVSWDMRVGPPLTGPVDTLALANGGRGAGGRGGRGGLVEAAAVAARLRAVLTRRAAVGAVVRAAQPIRRDAAARAGAAGLAAVAAAQTGRSPRFPAATSRGSR